MVSKWEKEVISPSPVLTVVLLFGNTTTWIEIIYIESTDSVKLLILLVGGPEFPSVLATCLL